ncbi:hypothetical protein, partial [Staphylococcus aureus]|uniref:hypothetical protein n=1 Tax=Staphylococcus aureus TaxID=1280 RepID=UPI0038B2C530
PKLVHGGSMLGHLGGGAKEEVAFDAAAAGVVERLPHTLAIVPASIVILKRNEGRQNENVRLRRFDDLLETLQLLARTNDNLVRVNSCGNSRG